MNLLTPLMIALVLPAMIHGQAVADLIVNRTAVFRGTVDMQNSNFQFPRTTLNPAGGCAGSQTLFSLQSASFWACSGGTWVNVSGSGGAVVKPCTVTVTSNQASTPATCGYRFGVRAIAPGVITASATGTGDLYFVGEGSGVTLYGSGTAVPTCVSGSCAASPIVVADWPDSGVRIAKVAVSSGTLGAVTDAQDIIGTQRVIAAPGGRVVLTTLSDGTQEIDFARPIDLELPISGRTTGSAAALSPWWSASGSTQLSVSGSGTNAPFGFVFTDDVANSSTVYTWVSLPATVPTNLKITLYAYAGAGAVGANGMVARFGITTACWGTTAGADNTEDNLDVTFNTNAAQAYYTATLTGLRTTGCSGGNQMRVGLRRLAPNAADTLTASAVVWKVRIYE